MYVYEFVPYITNALGCQSYIIFCLGLSDDDDDYDKDNNDKDNHKEDSLDKEDHNKDNDN